jgi:carbon starvation protein
MVMLVAVTMTASYQKIFAANPNLGFLSKANVLVVQIASGQIVASKIAETQRLIFNQRLDAVVTATLALMILALLAEAVVEWYRILSGRREAVMHEAPYVATRWAAGFTGTAHGDD